MKKKNQLEFYMSNYIYSDLAANNSSLKYNEVQKHLNSIIKEEQFKQQQQRKNVATISYFKNRSAMSNSCRELPKQDSLEYTQRVPILNKIQQKSQTI